MRRSSSIRKPTTPEMQKLEGWIEEAEQVRERRCAEAIFLHGQGITVHEIARSLHAHVNTIYADLQGF